MSPELREKIISYNKRVKVEREKAEDMETVAAALKQLPPGQLKKILTLEVLDVLAKYGVEI